MIEKGRVLVTTADIRCWPAGEPILFLGDWCELPVDKVLLRQFDYIIARPYGVSQYERSRDRLQIKELHSAISSELLLVLNNHHKTSFSARYWDIYIGPWLRVFTEILFNRWHTLHFVIENYNVKSTVFMQYSEEEIIPKDMTDFVEMYFFDGWNHIIYAEIIKYNNKVKCIESLESVFSDNVKLNTSKPYNIKETLKGMTTKIIDIFEKVVVSHNDGFIYGSHLSNKVELMLLVQLRQFPMKWKRRSVPDSAVDIKKRSLLLLDASKSKDFNSFIRSFIFKNIPTTYLEGYNQLREKTYAVPWPFFPKFIFTAYGHFEDDFFKLWAAEKVYHGAPYIIGQHGGNYGTAKFVPNSNIEKFEIDVSDRYLTWGWKQNISKCYPAMALNMSGKRTVKSNPNGGAVLIQLNRDLRDTTWDETFFYKQYLNNQFSFVSNLPVNLQERLTIRLHGASNRLGWSEDKLWLDKFSSIDLDYGKENIKKLIKKNRLIIHSYNSTGILELLAYDIPTIFFWDINCWPIRNEALPYYEKLIDVGVFHLSPESAAYKVKEVWDDLDCWWSSSELQSARKMFCEQFANIPNNPVAVMTDALTCDINLKR